MSPFPKRWYFRQIEKLGLVTLPKGIRRMQGTIMMPPLMENPFNIRIFYGANPAGVTIYVINYTPMSPQYPYLYGEGVIFKKNTVYPLTKL